MTAPIRVLIVDDDALVRSGLTMMLSGAPQIEVIGEADDGRGVLAAVDLHRPDVVLMDIRMPRLDGIAATRLLSAQPHPPAVLVLTTFDADELVLRALQAGAAGFLLKDSPPADIVRAIDAVHAGDGMLSPRITRRLINLVAGDPDAAARREQARQRLAALTPREREVAAAVADGSSNAEIATRLHMSLATVKAHVSRLLVKLDAANRVQIALLVQDAAASRPRRGDLAVEVPGFITPIARVVAHDAHHRSAAASARPGGMLHELRRWRRSGPGLAASVGNVDDRNGGPDQCDQDQLAGAHRVRSRHHRSMQRPQMKRRLGRDFADRVSMQRHSGGTDAQPN